MHIIFANMNVKLYSWSRTFRKVVRQHIWGAAVVIIPSFLHIISEFNSEKKLWKLVHVVEVIIKTRICAAEMAVRYAALSACRKVRMPSVRAEKCIRDASGWRKDVTDGNDNGTDGQTDGQTDRWTDRVRRNMRPPHREEGRIIIVARIFWNTGQYSWP